MRVTTKGLYALRAMIILAMKSDEKPLSIRKISEQENISALFLEQIFTQLKKFGLVRSTRGAGGGFILNKKASEITVQDILEAVEEGARLAPCCSSRTVGAKHCSRSHSCVAMGFWHHANNYISQFFESYSLLRVVNEFERDNVVIKSRLDLIS